MWFFARKYKVFLPFGAMTIETRMGDLVAVPNADLATWLAESNFKYEIMYERKTGKRWLEFNDKQAATMCKLVFG